jgi:hypothetical protein
VSAANSRAPRRVRVAIVRSAAALACVGGWLLVVAGTARASNAFAWAPPDSPQVARGRQVARRFDQESLWEISVEVNDAFALDNRRAIGVAEEELRRIPGIRRVFGPAQLADVMVDADGRISARAVLDRGPGEGEASRQRVVRRDDALGWFLAPDGSRVRFLIDADDLAAARRSLERAIASSGVEILHAAGAHVGGEALWPDPVDDAALWSGAAFAAGWILVALGIGRWAFRALGRLPPGRRALVIGAAFVGGGAPLAFCAVAGVRDVAARTAVAAAVAATLGLLRDGPPSTRGRAGSPRARSRRPAARPPVTLLVAALAVVGFAAAPAAGLRLGTQQWRRTPFLFVSVRGDMEQPVVLREVRRLTDFLRAQPGVENAWSVADLFFGVAQPGEEVSRIPDSADMVRRLLVQARNDPAIALELAPDHREALVVVRFDDEPATDRPDRLEIYDGLARYLRTELRTALVAVDLSDSHHSAVTRAVGKGLLASDARERIERICARSGRTLNDAALASVERVARQAAILPAADLGKLRAEIVGIVRAFFQEPTVAGAISVAAQERTRIGEELGGASNDSTVEDVRRVLAEHLGPALRRQSDQGRGDRLAALAQALQPRLVRARQRQSARINFRAMLYGADLPTEGMLSDEVRSATLEAMGPVVGIPVAPDTPGALHLDAVAVGGAANDRALSDFLRPALRAGAAAGIVVLAVLLTIAGGVRGLLWLPVALSPAAVALMAPATFGAPMGMVFLSLVAGTLAGGAAWTVALAARRRE